MSLADFIEDDVNDKFGALKSVFAGEEEEEEEEDDLQPEAESVKTEKRDV
jgi:hypothetical protein